MSKKFDYVKLKTNLTNADIPFRTKYAFIYEIIKSKNISFFDIINFMPSKVTLHLFLEYCYNFHPFLETFVRGISNSHQEFEGNSLRSNFIMNINRQLYEKIDQSIASIDFRLHTFMMIEVLPRALFPLISEKKFDFEAIFDNILDHSRFDQVFLGSMEINLQDTKTISKQMFAVNLLNLISNLKYFVIKAFGKNISLIEELLQFLKQKKQDYAVNHPVLDNFPELKSEILNQIDNQTTDLERILIHNEFPDISQLFGKSTRQIIFNTFLDTDYGLTFVDNFENKIKNIDILLKYTSKVFSTEDGNPLWNDFISCIQYFLDCILEYDPPRYFHQMQGFLSFLRMFNLIITKKFVTKRPHYNLLSLILWRVFRYALYANHLGSILLDFILRNFDEIYPYIKILEEKFIYSLCCYLYVTESTKRDDKNNKRINLLIKEGVIKILLTILKRTEIKDFVNTCYFLDLDYESIKLIYVNASASNSNGSGGNGSNGNSMKGMNKSIIAYNIDSEKDNMNEILQRVIVDIKNNSKFLEKIVLLLAYTKNIIQEIYGSQETKKHEEIIELYSLLMTLFDMQEVKFIRFTHKPNNYQVFEKKFILTIECLGLIGAYEKIYTKTIHKYHAQHKSEMKLKRGLKPLQLIEFIKGYVDDNKYYNNMRISGIYKITSKANSLFLGTQNGQPQFTQNNPKDYLNTSIDEFSIVIWICNLAFGLNTEYTEVFGICMDALVSDHDLTLMLMPYILEACLQNLQQNALEKLAKEINNILKTGKYLHKKPIIDSLKMLEMWDSEDLQKIEKLLPGIGSMQQKNPNSSKINQTSEQELSKMLNFHANFETFKKLIDQESLIKAQISVQDFKSAALNLEKSLEKMDLKDPFHEGEYESKLRQLYDVYCTINTDYKYLNIEEIMKYLNIKPNIMNNDPRIDDEKNEVANRFRQINFMPIINEDLKELCQLQENHLLIATSSNTIPNVIDDGIYKALLISILFLCADSYQRPNDNQANFIQIAKMIRNIKLSLALGLVGSVNNYDYTYTLFLKINQIVDLEILIEILKYCYHINNACNKTASTATLNINLGNDTSSNSNAFHSKYKIDSMDVCNDEPSLYLLLKKLKGISNSTSHVAEREILTTLNEISYHINVIYQRLKKLYTNHNNFSDWVNTVKFIIGLIKNIIPQCFDNIYLRLVFKLFKLSYKTGDYQVAIAYGKKLPISGWNKSHKANLIRAKLIKKTGITKEAINLLEGLKEKNQSISDNIEVRLKTIKYMQEYYSTYEINKKFEALLQLYKDDATEKLYFKYAKFLDEVHIANNYEKMILYYLNSTTLGHQYLFQSLPRALRLWMELVNVPNLKKNIESSAKRITEIIAKNLLELELYKLVHFIQFFVSRLEHQNEFVVEVLCQVLAKIAAAYPQQSVWWLLPLKYFNYAPKNSEASSFKCQKIEKAHKILECVKKIKFESYKAIEEAEEFYKALIDFGSMRDTNIVPKELLRPQKGKILLPLRRYLDPVLPKRTDIINENFNPYNKKPVYILSVSEQLKIMPSKEKPKCIAFNCSDGKKVLFLLKAELKGDVRKESRTIDYVNFVNIILEKSKITKEADLKMKNFSIIAMSSRVNLSEWVENTKTIKAVIESQWNKVYPNPKDSLDQLTRQCAAMHKKGDNSMWEKLTGFKPVLNKYFWEHFRTPEEWYQAQINYIKSTAAWSAFGYLIGLGDRHCDNILFEKNSGTIIHIDFDCIFHKGKILPVPEIVEFRLTKNIESIMGAFRCYGLFLYYFKQILLVFQKNLNDLLGALDSFIHDPLLEVTNQFNPSNEMEKIKKKIQLSNYKNIEDAVIKIIESCKSDLCLREMFFGWMPFV